MIQKPVLEIREIEYVNEPVITIRLNKVFVENIKIGKITRID